MFELIPRRRSPRAPARPKRDLFNWFFEDLTLPDFWTGEPEWMPAFDLSETENAIVVKAELPGMDVKDIDIALTDGLLTIKGERKLEKEDKKEDYHRIERQFGSFSRSLNLGERVKADGIEAAYKDGILTVTLPKAEESKPKKIEVKS
jgi:HSP20 family protein